MIFKAKLTLCGVIEMDTDHYEGATPEACIKEQLQYWEEGACDPAELLEGAEDYQESLEMVTVTE